MAVNDVYQVRVTTALSSGSSAVNVFYYRVASIGTGVAAAEIVRFVRANISLTMRAIMPANHVIVGHDCINGMNNSDFHSEVNNLPGQRSGNPLPPFAMISARSPLTGPGHRRGRHYLPVGTGTDLTPGGGISTSLRTALELAVFQFGTVIGDTAGSATPVTVSPAFKLGVTPTVREELAGTWEFNLNWGSIDSRRPGPVWAPSIEPPP